jgi:hypothetical protein
MYFIVASRWDAALLLPGLLRVFRRTRFANFLSFRRVEFAANVRDVGMTHTDTSLSAEEMRGRPEALACRSSFMPSQPGFRHSAARTGAESHLPS